MCLEPESPSPTLSFSHISAAMWTRNMGKDKALYPESKSLSLECLEPRILLDAVNPGEAAIIQDGDELFFVQGENTEQPNDLGGDPKAEWVVVARYSGPGSARLYDSTGENILDNGDKIGDIDILNATEQSNLVFENWVFSEGFDLESIGGTRLSDQPDTADEAQEITVPEGESGDAANYNTGRAVVSGSGEDIDYYKFSAQEAERFLVTPSGTTQAVIGLQYGDAAIQWQPTNDYTLGDGNGNDEQDDVTIYLEVTGLTGAPYNLVIDRIEQDLVFAEDEEGNPSEENTTVGEDFPESAAAAIDLSWDAATQAGIGAATPTVELFGEGPGTSGHDFFTLTLDPLATLEASGFSGTLSSVNVLDQNGQVLTDLLLTGEYQNADNQAVEITLDVSSTGSWDFDTSIKPGALSDMVERPVNANGEYTWFEGSPQPWMTTINETDITAPAGSGIGVITGAVTFEESTTGFGLFGLDGSLKGTIEGLEPGETVQEIVMGYMNGDGAGLDIGGNVDRLLVRTSVAELSETDSPGEFDEILPAEIEVGGYLMEFQSGWTIMADIEVRGEGPFTDYEFVYDEEEFGFGVFDPIHEGILTPEGRGFVSEGPGSAYIVGSPTGEFTIEGDLASTFNFSDPQDWYAFTPGVGRNIEVDLSSTSFVNAAWVFSPSGRLITVVTPDEPGEFVAGEAGAYHIQLGTTEDIATGRWDLTTLGDYSLSVSGARPVHLGGVVAGSEMFVGPNPTDNLEFGDDITDTEILVGFDGDGGFFGGETDEQSGSTYQVSPPGEQVSIASVGILSANQEGVYADVTLWASGSLGLASGYTAATYDGDYAGFYVGGDFGRFETRSTDETTPGDMQVNFMEVMGDLVEVQAHGLFGGTVGTNGFIDEGGDVSVQGSVGSMVVDGDFNADMDVFGAGIDLFYVGGDFNQVSSLGTGSGTDIAFAFVEGDIYNGDQLVEPVPAQGSIRFTDDGGTAVYMEARSLHTEVVERQNEQGETINVTVPIPATVEYRFLPLELAGTDQEVGSVPVEIVASDALTITVLGEGHVDLPRITFGALGDSFLQINGTHFRSSADVFSVETEAAETNRIVNYTRMGDILNIQAGSVDRIFAAGNLGLSERFVSQAGRRLNPDTAIFAPPAVEYISEDNLRHFSGIVRSGDVKSMVANGSIGDAYVAGDIQRVQANADGPVQGRAFTFRNMRFDDQAMNGIAGVLYAGGDIDHVNPGTGLFGGSGGVPVGAVIATGEIGRFTAVNSMIHGPVMSESGITQITAINTPMEEATIGAGAHLSDWAHWDNVRSTTNGVRLDRMFMFGGASGMDSSMVQVGVLGQLLVGPQADGVVDTDIWAIGDNQTEEGINSITILGGDFDGTNNPPYGGLVRGFGENNEPIEGDIITSQKIGNIFVANNLVNLDVRSEKSIGNVTVQDSIRVTQDVSISAPLSIGNIRAHEIVGTGSLNFGTGQLGNVFVNDDVRATVLSSGRVNSVHIGGTLQERFEVTGSSGFLNTFRVGNVTSSGSIVSANFIRNIMVFSGDLDGDVSAGGSENGTLAIGRLQVWNGDLGGDVTVLTNESAVSPGGGIGFLFVSGDVLGDITTATFTDPGTGDTTSGDVGTAILLGDLRGDMDIAGGVQRLQMPRGRITSNGDSSPRVDIEGNVGFFMVRGGGGASAVDDDLEVGGNLNRLIIGGGDFAGDLTVDQKVGFAMFQGPADMTGVLNAGSIQDLLLFGDQGVANTVSTSGRLGHLLTLNGVSSGGAVQANGGLGRLRSFGDVDGPITVGGTGADFIQIGSMLNAPLSVQSGDLDTFIINNWNQDAVNAEIEVAGRLGFAQINGNVVSDIEVGNNQPDDGIGTLRLMGDLEADLDVDGKVEKFQLIGGQVTDNGGAQARIQVSRDMNSFRAFGFTGGVEAISDDIFVGGRLGFFQLSGGNFAGELEAGTMGTIIYSNPGGIQGNVTSNGNIDRLVVTNGTIGDGGGGPTVVSAFDRISTVEAWGGLASDGQILAGTPGTTPGGIERVRVARGMNGLVEARSGSLDSVQVYGDMNGGELRAASSIFNAFVSGEFIDSDIQANSLGRVTVNGGLSGTPPLVHEIHADTGSFVAQIRGETFEIGLGPDQEPEIISGGVKVSVG